MADIPDLPTIPLSISQATSPNVSEGVSNGLTSYDPFGTLLKRNTETGEFYDPGGLPGDAVAPIDPGVGAYDDGTTDGIQAEIDAAAASADSDVPEIVITAQRPTKQTATSLNSNAANEQIVTQGNILDNFASYTYRASVYLTTPEQYRSLVYSAKRTVNGYQLLFQSGGAPNNVGGFQGALSQSNQTTTTIPGAGQADAGRSPAFPLDFYIDTVTIENLLPNSGTGSPHASVNIKFTVVEPNGITLIDRLYEAVQDAAPKEGSSVNYSAAIYLMVIRFYGYDENGKIMQIGNLKNGASDPNAVVEKFIPFRLNGIGMKINNSLVKYEFDGKTVGLGIGVGTRRGTIPYDMQLSANNLKDLLGSATEYDATETNADTPGAGTTATQGNSSESGEDTTRESSQPGNPSAPPTANAAATSKRTVKPGLTGAMNAFQRDLCTGANAVYSVPDTYEIVWAPAPDGSQPIRDATILLPGKKQETKQTPMAQPATSNANNLDENKVSVDNTVRNYSITAGMQMVQAIDLAIRNSSYIYNQAQTIRNAITGDEEPNSTASAGKPVRWYNISFQAIPKKYDKLRNDYAFHIRFIISPYTIDNFESKYFPLNKFRGVHKSYPYWFTGKNTAVIDYQENLNNLYNITVSGSNPTNSLAEQKRRQLTSSMREIPFYTYQSSSSESRQGTENTANEVSANLAENLNDDVGLAKTNLRIIGDPSWLQQASAYAGADSTQFNYSAYLPDGTINFDAGQVLFEVAWQRPEDYDLAKGLADPYSRTNTQARQPLQSRVYTAQRIVSEFHQGKFEQLVDGKLYHFIKPSGNNKATTAPVPNQSAVDDARVARQNTVLGTRSTASTPTAEANQTGEAGTTGNYGSGNAMDLANDGSQYGRGDESALPAPTMQGPVTNEQSGFSSAPPGPNDGAQPSLPPGGATDGSGGVLSPTDIELAGLAAEGFGPPPVVGRLNFDTLNSEDNIPQIISREA